MNDDFDKVFAKWLFLFLSLMLVLAFLSGCTTTKLVREITGSVQAREQAAHVDLFAEQRVKPAVIETQTKKEILTEFENCSTGLRNCANNLEQVSAELDQTQKKYLKLKVVKNRIVTALVILSVLVVVFIVARVLVFVYLRK